MPSSTRGNLPANSPDASDSQPRRGRKPHLLLIGPRIIENNIVGGDMVQFEGLISNLQRRGRVGLTVISTARLRARRSRVVRARVDAAAFLKTMALLWRHVATADLVVWYVSSRGALLSGGFVWLVCALRRRPLGIRFFGGSFDAQLASAAAIFRLIAARTFLRADVVLSHTERLTKALSASSTTAWFPNTRDMPRRRQSYRRSCRRLLFLSRLLPEKGLPELLEAASRFPGAVRLSVFGPEMRGFNTRDISRLPNATYGGTVAPERVAEVMENHDALVLPTYYYDEGYPGVVIEAFQMGLPVIVTRLPALQELVTDGRDGLWVTVGSVESLVDAVASISSDDRLFHSLRCGALETGDRYRTDRAAAVVENLTRRAAASGKESLNDRTESPPSPDAGAQRVRSRLAAVRGTGWAPRAQSGLVA